MNREKRGMALAWRPGQSEGLLFSLIKKEGVYDHSGHVTNKESKISIISKLNCISGNPTSGFTLGH
jgi:hypothetical protein